VTYHDQPYYKEFRDLLTRIQSGVNDLKEENQRLKDENLEFSSQLKDVRGQLAEASREMDRLKKEQPGKTADQGIDPLDTPGAVSGESGPSSPSLFDTLDENERRILRQQIIDLISRIDKHLDRAGSSAAAES